MSSIFGERSRWQYLSYAGMALFAVFEVNALLRTNAHAGLIAAVLALTAVMLAAWFLLMHGFRSSTFAPALIAVIGAGAVATAVLTAQGASIIPAIVAISMAANRFEARTALWFAIALTAAYLAAVAYHVGFDAITLFSYATGMLFAFAASQSVARLRASRDAQVQAAALNERARIAREIHDVLAHTLAALAVQLESARVMLEQSGTNKDALATVERSHRLVKEGLEEVGRAVSALRGDRIPGPSQLRELVSEFETDTGVESDFKVEGAARQLPPEAELALYRAAQEALTNVRKHADATRVEVALNYQPEGTELRVTDVGTSKNGAGNGGYGIAGMRERAALLGGTLEAGSTADGYEVRIWIPA